MQQIKTSRNISKCTKFTKEEFNLIKKYSEMINAKESVFIWLWVMYGVYLCKLLDENKELERFFEYGSILSIRYNIHKGFLNRELPPETKEFFSRLLEEFEYNLNGVEK